MRADYSVPYYSLNPIQLSKMNSDLNPDASIFTPTSPFILSTHISTEVAQKVLDETPNVQEKPLEIIQYSTFNSTPHIKYYEIECKTYLSNANIKLLNSKSASFQLYKDGLPLAGYNYHDTDAIDYFLRALTATYTGTFDSEGRQIKKYYTVRSFICTIYDIDNAFRRRFRDPNKRWPLRMDPRAISHGWENIEVSFILSNPEHQ